MGKIDTNRIKSKKRNRAMYKQHTASTVNLEYLQEMADGDQRFIIEVIEMFMNDAPDVLQQALVYHKSENFALLKISVHKLKSSIKMLGDEALANLAQDIENLAMNQSTHEVITPELQKFVKGVHKLLEGLNTELKHLRSKRQEMA